MRGQILGRYLKSLALAAAALLPAGAAQAQTACLPKSKVICVDQGAKWNMFARRSFYSQDQGSQMIPYTWAKALKLPDGSPWFADSFQRYGYLPDTYRNNGVPVGFTTAGTGQNQQLGMTCAACHTRQIKVGNFEYRLDGGPAIVDFQGLLTDMVDAVGAVLNDSTAFDQFAKAVLGGTPTQSQKNALRTKVAIWYEREDTLRDRAYGTPDIWGLGRLDAVAMIFNRLTGLDLGPPPTYLIPDNIKPADAPVRYPFLWNAGKQDRTQWPGFSGNGTAVTALARNTGEVIGVFATFHPISPSRWPGNVNFVDNNSANFPGLRELERLINKIGAPKWPKEFPIISSIVPRGNEVYQQQCAGCHGIKPGKPGFPNIPTWATPLQDVGTDSREYDILGWTVDPGILINMGSALFPKFKVTNPSKAFDLLEYSVIGSMVESGAIIPALAEDLLASIGSRAGATAKKAQDELENSFAVQSTKEEGKFLYESRVMEGIWGAAPYLHNGSVPTMSDLLKPADERPVTFAVGPVFDPINIGLADEQPGSYTRTTTGCATPAERNSGNSRCGHEFGTTLPLEDKRALLEYIKTL